MPVSPIIEALRFAEDNDMVSDCIIGNNPYQVNLITIVNAQRSVGQSSGLGTRTSQRITVAAAFDGYLSFSDGDGYLNPPAWNLRSKTPLLAGQAFTEMEWMVGPLVYPYLVGGVAGGTDANIFYPTTLGNVNIYVQLLGPGLNPIDGQYFKIQEVVLDNKTDDINIHYHLRLIGTNEVT